jgi:hypothetical protein
VGPAEQRPQRQAAAPVLVEVEPAAGEVVALQKLLDGGNRQGAEASGSQAFQIDLAPSLTVPLAADAADVLHPGPIAGDSGVRLKEAIERDPARRRSRLPLHREGAS